ncbi:hypothetical protein [Halorubellus salinus]|uniref:hypothetical protein n=1 Tax=Halorubellus salinus TaxID=755309 RepID=UPI001D05CE8A|nr:hypothetical protein [Halorubellus salinus]
MRTTLAVSLVLVAVLGAVSVAAAGPLGPATVGSQAPAVGDTGGTAPNGSNASMGAEVSAFMQASASDANASVDEGMFAAEWNQSNASANALVDKRAKTLESRLNALQNQKERLLAQKDNLSDVAYTARMSALAARIDALQNALNATSDRARMAGVNATRLDELRTNANNLTGPEVAAIARNLSVGVGGPPAGTPGKGPGGAGPPGQNETTGNGAPTANDSTPGNGTPGGKNGSTGGPAVENPGNDTIQGPTTNGSDGSVTAGNSSGGGPGGSGSDGGSGSGGGNGNGSGNGGGSGNGPNALTATGGEHAPSLYQRIAGRR